MDIDISRAIGSLKSFAAIWYSAYYVIRPVRIVRRSRWRPASLLVWLVCKSWSRSILFPPFLLLEELQSMPISLMVHISMYRRRNWPNLPNWPCRNWGKNAPTYIHIQASPSVHEEGFLSQRHMHTCTHARAGVYVDFEEHAARDAVWLDVVHVRQFTKLWFKVKIETKILLFT